MHRPKGAPSRPADPITDPLSITLTLDPTTAVDIHAAILDRIDKITAFIVREPKDSGLLPFYRDECTRLQCVHAQLNRELWGNK